ncbi:30S ribosomal protein S9 [Candidatus Pacearchaeota archaeon]|nr:30S ribosomal protein S9 [Candidatus Pacearchaeota archaeon]
MEKVKKAKKPEKADFGANGIIVSGKKKTAIAKASIKEGNGRITINKMPYQHLSFLRKLMIEEPIMLAKDVLGDFKFDIAVNASGGGNESQIEASRLAIAKALVQFTRSDSLRKAFLDYDRNMLIADTRRKEQRKPSSGKARKKRQKSYR